MAKQRYHFWRLTAQRFRKEHDGSLTPMTPPDYLEFPDKQLDQKEKSALQIVRRGQQGIVDSILGWMSDLRKFKKPYKDVYVQYPDVDSKGQKT